MKEKDKFGKNWYEPIKLKSNKNQIYVNKFNVQANRTMLQTFQE